MLYDSALSDRLKSARVGAGAYIRELRGDKMTQRELAEKLWLLLPHLTGSVAFVDMVERGVTYIKPESLEAWADALEVDKQEFERNLLKTEVLH